jgi:hypothetical protein
VHEGGPSTLRAREPGRKLTGSKGLMVPVSLNRLLVGTYGTDDRNLSGHWPLAPSPGVEPEKSASFGGSSLKSVRTKVLVSSAGIEPATTDFVDQSLDEPPGRGDVIRFRGGRKRTRTPHPFRGAHCFRNRSGSVAGFSSVRWSMRESNPLRRAFQTPALPIELTDQDHRD